MHLQWIQHTLARYDDLFRLFLYWQRPDQRRDLLSSLPLGQLRQPLLPSPHGGVDNLEEKLSCARVEDEDSSVDWFRRQVTLEGLVDRNTVDVGIIDELDDL